MPWLGGSSKSDFRLPGGIKMKWCNYIGCSCDYVEELTEGDCNCGYDCDNCQDSEEIEPVY